MKYLIKLKYYIFKKSLKSCVRIFLFYLNENLFDVKQISYYTYY